MPEDDFLELDVRPLFAARRPPMSAILDAIDQLKPGQALRLIAPMEPAPLYALLAQRGFRHAASRAADDSWEIIFRR